MLDSGFDKLIYYTPQEILTQYPDLNRIKGVCTLFEEYLGNKINRDELGQRLGLELGGNLCAAEFEEIMNLLDSDNMKECCVNE